MVQWILTILRVSFWGWLIWRLLAGSSGITTRIVCLRRSIDIWVIFSFIYMIQVIQVRGNWPTGQFGEWQEGYPRKTSGDMQNPSAIILMLAIMSAGHQSLNEFWKGRKTVCLDLFCGFAFSDEACSHGISRMYYFYLYVCIYCIYSISRSGSPRQIIPEVSMDCSALTHRFDVDP